MGGEVKTNLSDDFKAMETEMGVRHEGRYCLSRCVFSGLTEIIDRR